jgi:anti-sigma B factor antagonist
LLRKRVGYNGRMPVNATIEKFAEGSAVVTLVGSMTLGTALKVADSQIHGAIAEGVTRMVIDLTGVDYLDSAGLGMLVFVYGTLNEKKGVLRLCGVAPRVRTLLKVTQTDKVLTIDETREESLAALTA